jgi:hypothetical protein
VITYKWEVLSLYTKPSLNGLTNVVKRVTWRYQITDGGNYGEIYQDTHLPDPTDSNTYIAYPNLSEEIILGWVQNIEDVPALEAELQLRLEKSKNPDIVENKLPWSLEHRYNPREDLYVVVFNDEPVYGPVHWNSDGMNASLEACGHPRSIPENILAFRKGIVPHDKPLIVSSTLRIYKANLLNNQPPKNPFFDNGHIEWDFSGDIAVGTYQSVEKDVSFGQNHLRHLIKNWCTQMSDTLIKININNEDHCFHSQLLYRLELGHKINTMDDTSTCFWKSCEMPFGNWFSASKANLIEILTILEDRNTFIINWEREKNMLLTQCTTITEVINLSETLHDEMNAWLNANTVIL